MKHAGGRPSKVGPRFDAQITFRTTPEQAEALYSHVRAARMSTGAWLRGVIDSACKAKTPNIPETRYGSGGI